MQKQVNILPKKVLHKSNHEKNKPLKIPHTQPQTKIEKYKYMYMYIRYQICMRCILEIYIDILWVWPRPNNSHNQDYYIAYSGFPKA